METCCRYPSTWPEPKAQAPGYFDGGDFEAALTRQSGGRKGGAGTVFRYWKTLGARDCRSNLHKTELLAQQHRPPSTPIYGLLGGRH